jgi:hypothetical protein
VSRLKAATTDVIIYIDFARLTENLSQYEVIMDTAVIRAIKHIVIRALVSDDEIMEAIALKGGSAIEEFYNPHNKARASIDIDFSLNDEFVDFEDIHTKVHKLLDEEFSSSPYRMLDFSFYPNPKLIKDKIRSGYKIELKVVSQEVYVRMQEDVKRLRYYSYTIDSGKTFKVEISSYEFCDGCDYKKFDNYDVRVYTPQMIICEKLRAICQQTPQYKMHIQSKRLSSARAKDFYDIHYLITHFNIDLNTNENRSILGSMFAKKKVPLTFLSLIHDSYDQHLLDEPSLSNTVPAVDYKGFRFYFDFVESLVSELDLQI